MQEVPCVVEFRQGSLCTAGIGDISARISKIVNFADAWGCQAVVPSPYETLVPTHNHGLSIAPSVPWSRYYDFGDVQQTLPAKSKATEQATADAVPGSLAEEVVTIVEDVIPSPMQMEAWAAQNTNGLPRRMVLTFREHVVFWDDTVAKALQKAADAGPFPATHHFTTSQMVDTRVSAVRRALFDGAGFMGLHLRRGDRLSQYPEGCADVAAVLWNVLKKQQEAAAESTLTASNITVSNAIFVATDETDQGYLKRLRTALERYFERVRFEFDIPEDMLIPEDNYFNYLVIHKMVSTFWKWFIDYHPAHLERYNIECDPHGRIASPRRPPPGRPTLPPSAPISHIAPATSGLHWADFVRLVSNKAPPPPPPPSHTPMLPPPPRQPEQAAADEPPVKFPLFFTLLRLLGFCVAALLVRACCFFAAACTRRSKYQSGPPPAREWRSVVAMRVGDWLRRRQYSSVLHPSHEYADRMAHEGDAETSSCSGDDKAPRAVQAGHEDSARSAASLKAEAGAVQAEAADAVQAEAADAVQAEAADAVQAEDGAHTPLSAHETQALVEAAAETALAQETPGPLPGYDAVAQDTSVQTGVVHDAVFHNLVVQDAAVQEEAPKASSGACVPLATSPSVGLPVEAGAAQSFAAVSSASHPNAWPVCHESEAPLPSPLPYAPRQSLWRGPHDASSWQAISAMMHAAAAAHRSQQSMRQQQWQASGQQQQQQQQLPQTQSSFAAATSISSSKMVQRPAFQDCARPSGPENFSNNFDNRARANMAHSQGAIPSDLHREGAVTPPVDDTPTNDEDGTLYSI